MIQPNTQSILDELARRPGHDEVKAAFKELLVAEFGVEREGLRFEVRRPVIRGRLDALVGRTVFEAKRNLEREIDDVVRRMPDYLRAQEEEDGAPYVGIASDGRKWIVYELIDGSLITVKETNLDPSKGEEFLAWLDGVIAIKASLKPDAPTVRLELGQDSLAYRHVDRELRAIWNRLAEHPTESLKRQLWADLLKIVHGREVGDSALWFQHTYLVIVAKCIALAVMDLAEDDPQRMLSGDAFTARGVHGAVESDFFDWVLADPAGDALVRRIMAHVRRFRLKEVDSDVLKVLYESLIDRDERHGLGEYYTPDWLAAKVVRQAVERPAEQRVLDPACGSGTFLFHAVRRFLAEVDEGGMPVPKRAAEACSQVAGLDIHPVAVIIARVTYLLALAPVIAQRAGAISVPVFLGDSLQLSIKDEITGKELVIRVPPPPAGADVSPDARGREQLSFPETFCRDPGLFDKAIEEMRVSSLTDRDREHVEAALTRITEQHYKADLSREQALAISDLGKTYEVFDRLRREGRDTIWAYVARNLSRPLHFSSGGGWANVLVGNPPWVAYRNMSQDLQKRFKELGKGERLYGARAPSQYDLCALFTVRSSHLYLRAAGRIGFVLPLAALSRVQYKKFRTGRYGNDNISWQEAWTTDVKVRGGGAIFPVPSCVLFGRKAAIGKATPARVTQFTGPIPIRDASEAVADVHLKVAMDVPAPKEARQEGGSPYRKRFRCGANLFPRVLVLVERQQAGRLGGDPSAPLLKTQPSKHKPWKDLEPIEGQVENEFVRRALLGESIAPFRVLGSVEAIIPVIDGVQLDALSSTSYPKLASWLNLVEKEWDNTGKGSRTFAEQMNHVGHLRAQFPIPEVRVVYTKSGTLPAACLLRDAEAVIDQKLFWSEPASEDEGHYLASIFNADTTRRRVQDYQSRGQFGTRDFDKVMFNLPIPIFSSGASLHLELAAAGAEAETVAASVIIPQDEKFVAARRRIRAALNEHGVGIEIEKLVDRLLGSA